MEALTHVRKDAQPGMVDVGAKKITKRSATARARLWVDTNLEELLSEGDIRSPKGAVFSTAIIGGTLGAKKTGELIPFCHPVGMENCEFKIGLLNQNTIEIFCTCEVEAKTGIEMESLTGASVAALTLYDMLKALKVEMVIQETRLLKKTGGKKDYEYGGD